MKDYLLNNLVRTEYFSITTHCDFFFKVLGNTALFKINYIINKQTFYVVWNCSSKRLSRQLRIQIRVTSDVWIQLPSVFQLFALLDQHSV